MTPGVAEHIGAVDIPGRRAPIVIFAGLLLAMLAAILALNDGHFVYSLDDPYIHLALAENIARGHYGINLSEPSAPSSSILWPLLLLPFSGTEFHDTWPLVLTSTFALASVGVLQAIVQRIAPGSATRYPWLPSAVVVVAAIGFNLPGLVFTGMEHSLQVLLALLLVWGLVVEAEESRAPWFLVAAVILGPLVRYESLGLSAAAILYLSLRGRPVFAIGLAAAVALPLVAFSAILLDLGLGWLPSSVLVKLDMGAGGTTLPEILARTARSLLEGDGVYSRLVLLCFLALFLWRARRLDERRNRCLAAAGAAMVLAHLAGGKYGWFGRYEVYVMVAACALTSYLWRRELLARAAQMTAGRVGTVAVLALLLLSAPTIGATILTPSATRNIYEQQFQMSRLIASLPPGEAVAVNDLGWASFRNDRYVLDLWGLGSAEAGRLRMAGEPGWMDGLVARHGVRFAMIYDGWFQGQVPERWRRLGELRLRSMRVTSAAGAVAFYATDPVAAAELAGRIEGFVATLPDGVSYVPAAE